MELNHIIFIILWGAMILYLSMDLLFPFILKGKVILKIQNEQLGRRIWRNLYWVFFLAAYFFIINSTRYFIFVTVFCILQIIREHRPIEIREKGIYFNFTFYRFKKILSYTWKNTNLLELHLKQNIAYYHLSVKDDEMALKMDEVLQGYITRSNPSSTA